MRAELRMADEIDKEQAEGSLVGHGGDRSKVRRADLDDIDVD